MHPTSIANRLNRPNAINSSPAENANSNSASRTLERPDPCAARQCPGPSCRGVLVLARSSAREDGTFRTRTPDFSLETRGKDQGTQGNVKETPGPRSNRSFEQPG